MKVLHLLKELKNTGMRSHADALFVSARVRLLYNDTCPISTQPRIHRFSWLIWLELFSDKLSIKISLLSYWLSETFNADEDRMILRLSGWFFFFFYCNIIKYLFIFEIYQNIHNFFDSHT